MQAGDPLVSIVITCFNQEAFIAEAVYSVLRQTYQNWECWIIDDGSTDGSADICREFTQKDGRIQFIQQANSGVSSARNNGYEHCKGDYIQFLDGDDFLLPQKLGEQIAFMRQHPAYAVTYTNHQHFWQETGQYAQYRFEVLQEHPLEQLLTGYDRGVSIPIHTALLHRSIWNDGSLPFPTDYPHRYEDWIFWVLIAKKNVRFFFLDQSLAIYRMHSKNFIGSPEELASNAVRAVFYIGSLLPDSCKSQFENDRLAFIFQRYAEQKKPVPDNRSAIKLVHKFVARFQVIVKRIRKSNVAVVHER